MIKRQKYNMTKGQHDKKDNVTKIQNDKKTKRQHDKKTT